MTSVDSRDFHNQLGADAATDSSSSCVAAMMTPRSAVAAIIVATFLARLWFASWMGLGIDESYMAATSRHLHLSYYDHPPVSWWLTWVAERVAGPGSDFWIRFPFVALFAVSSWLMFRLSTALYGERAALWAVVLFNVVPVLGITTGTWVLPEGPLVAALLGGTFCLVHALGSASFSWRGWLYAGAYFGIALCSKYTAGPIVLGVGLYLITDPVARPWLRRPHPYIAALVACCALAPVLIWNAEHHWASIRFQGARANGPHWHIFGPLSTMGGEAIFFLPWIFAPLLILLWRAARRGTGDRRSWLILCLSVPSFLLFELVSLRAHMLYHWVAPALMLALPLLGHAIDQRHEAQRKIRFVLVGTVVIIAARVILVASEVHFNWLPEIGEKFALGKDPDLAAVDWSTLREEMKRRDLLKAGTVVAAIRWLDAGKVDYALRGEATVICLGDDPREYGVIRPAESFVGYDVIIVAPKEDLGSLSKRFGQEFDTLEAIRPVTVLHAGKPAMLLPLFIGHYLHTSRVEQGTGALHLVPLRAGT
jgi:Dolichyl-phosphate-mannose-protein mannosyltransferase